jgi:MFS family permease
MADVTDDAPSQPKPLLAGTLPMWVLGLVLAVDSADQSILRGVQELIKKDFHVSDAAIGFLASAFVLVNVIVTIPAGYLADRLHRKRVIALTIVLWSGITALAGAAQSFVQLLLVRGALGFGLGITEPSTNSMLVDYYPGQQRGRAFSIQQILVFIGLGVGLGAGGAVGSAIGWQWAFVLVGLPGVLTSLLVLRLREPRRGHGDALTMGIASSLDETEERPPLFEHGFATFVTDMLRGLRADIKTIISIPTMRFVLIGVGVLLFSVTGIGFWLPVYLHRFAHMTITEATGAVGGMFIIGGVSGTLLGGTVADRLYGKIEGARVAIPAYAIMAGTVLFLISFLPIPTPLVILLETLGMFVSTLAVPALRAGTGDAVPANLRGAGFAAFSLISIVSGAAVAPPLLGALSDATNLRIAFLICMPAVFVGAIILLRARKHLDEDVAKVLLAVQRAYQEQMALEEQRAAEEAADQT